MQECKYPGCVSPLVPWETPYSYARLGWPRARRSCHTIGSQSAWPVRTAYQQWFPLPYSPRGLVSFNHTGIWYDRRWWNIRFTPTTIVLVGQGRGRDGLIQVSVRQDAVFVQSWFVRVGRGRWKRGLTPVLFGWNTQSVISRPSCHSLHDTTVVVY